MLIIKSSVGLVGRPLSVVRSSSRSILAYCQLIAQDQRANELEMEQRKFEKKLASFPRSKVWDQMTQKNIDAVRAFIHRHPQPTISHMQNESVQERPLKGPFHVLPDTLPAPVEDDIRKALFHTINDLGDIEYEEPALAPVPVEWVSKRACGHERDKPSNPALPAKDCANELLILHVHGGAFLYVQCRYANK